MAFYDHFAKDTATGLGSLIESKTNENEFNYIAECLDENSEILEIGAGNGMFASIFNKNGYQNYDIVEPNDIMRNNIIKRGNIRNVKNYLIPNLTQEKDASYDLILLAHVFEHLNDYNESKIFISEVNRVLRPEGLIFIICPDYNNLKRDFHDVDFTHNNITTLRRVMQLLVNNDFKIVKFKYTYACFKGFLGYLMSKLVKAATFWAQGNCIQPCEGRLAYLDIKAYKLRLTFSRSFLIVGRKS